MTFSGNVGLTLMHSLYSIIRLTEYKHEHYSLEKSHYWQPLSHINTMLNVQSIQQHTVLYLGRFLWHYIPPRIFLPIKNVFSVGSSEFNVEKQQTYLHHYVVFHCMVCRISGAEAGGGRGYISPQNFRFLQILSRKFGLKANKALKLTKILNHLPQCWTRIGTAV